MMIYNFARHLNALRWCTPFKVTCEAWTKDPERLITNSHHLIPAPYSRPGSEYRDHPPGTGQTDLDLLKLPTIIFMQSGWSVYTLQQAARRSGRFGQTQATRIIFLGYAGTLQMICMQLMVRRSWYPRVRREKCQTLAWTCRIRTATRLSWHWPGNWVRSESDVSSPPN